MMFYYNFLISFANQMENPNGVFYMKILRDVFLKEEIINIKQSYFRDFIMQIAVDDGAY